MIAAGYTELLYAVFARDYPALEKKNVCGFGRDDGMMRMVGVRDTRAIDIVTVGGDVAYIQYNWGYRREADILG